jgi:uncharacterized membrane protein YhaH (DUF805 family)
MESLSLFFSTSGRIARKPFALAALLVYVMSFCSQFLLAAPVTAHASFVPFLAVQIVAGWAWYALHVKRLRDAGRGPGGAVALTVLYALAVVLLLLAMSAAQGPAPGAPSEEATAAGVFHLFLILFLIGLVLGDPNLGMFGVIILGVLALVMLPILIAIVFTLWAGTRPSLAPTSSLTSS